MRYKPDRTRPNDAPRISRNAAFANQVGERSAVLQKKNDVIIESESRASYFSVFLADFIEATGRSFC